MDRLSFYIDLYKKENERRSSLNNSLSIPIGILTGLIALFFYLVTEFNFEKEVKDLNIIAFVVFIFLAIGFWLTVVYYLFKSYNNLFGGYEYKGIPYTSVLNKQYNDLEEYCLEYKDSLPKTVYPDKLFEDQLFTMISEYLDIYLNLNDKKSEYLHKAKKFLFLCFISFFISLIPFSINYFRYRNDDKIHLIKIENIDDLEELLNKSKKNSNFNYHIEFNENDKIRKQTPTTSTTPTTSRKADKGRESTETPTSPTKKRE